MTASLSRCLLGLALFVAAATSASAQTYSWDPAVSGGVSPGGTGLWNQNGNNFWFDGTTNSAWIGGFVANFGGTAGTVTVDAAGVSASGLTFLTTGYTIDGTGVLTLTAPTITIGAGLTSTISAPIGGTVGLTLTGGGSLTLSSIASTYTGVTTINGGSTLIANNNLNLGTVPLVPTVDSIVLNNGTLSGGGMSAVGGGLAANRGIGIGSGGATFLNTTGGEFRIHGIIADATGVVAPGGLVSFQATGTGNVVIDNGTGLSGINLNNYTGGTAILPGGVGAIIPIQSSDGTTGPFGTGRIDFLGGSFRATGVGAITLHNDIRLSADTIVPTGGQLLTFSGPVELAGVGTRTWNNATAVVFSGVVTEGTPGSGFIKAGAGVLTFGASANNITGPITVNGGVLSTSVLVDGGLPSSLGTSSNAASNLVLNGGSLGYSGSTPTTTDRNYSVPGTAFGFDASGSVPTATLTISVLPTYSNTVPVRTLNLSGTNTGANTLNFNVVDFAAPGDVTGITKSGTGSWTLPGTHTYTGPTLISAGTLNLTGSVVGTNITINGATAALVQPSTGVIGTAASTFTLTAGTATLAGTNTHSGTNTLTGGFLNIQNAGALGTGGISLTATTLDNTGVGAITLTNTSAVTLNAGTFAFTGTNSLTIPGTVTAAGGRNITLNSTNGSVLNLGPFITTNANTTNHTINGPGNLLTFASFAINAGTTARTHNIAGTADVTILGAVTSTSAAHVLGITSTGTVNLNGVVSNTGSLTINNTTGTANLNADRSGTGGITLTSGLLNVTVATTYTGATVINGGTLALLNGVNLNGATAVTVNTGTLAVRPGILAATNALAGTLTLNPGSNVSMADATTSVLNITGASTLAPAIGAGQSAIITLDLGGTTTAADRVNFTAAATAGTNGVYVALNGIGATAPAVGSYTLFTAASGLGANVVLSNKVTINSVAYQVTQTSSANSLVANITGVTGLDVAYWTGTQGIVWNAVTGPNTNWNTSETGGTDAGAQPTIVTDVFFATTTPAASNLTNTLGTNYSINSLNFTAATGSVSIGGAHTLTIAGANATNTGVSVAAGSPAHTLDTAVALGGPQTWLNNSGNAFVVNGSLALSGSLTLLGTGDYTFNGAFTGTGSLRVFGSGVLNFGPVAKTITDLSFSTTTSGTNIITGASLTVNPTVDTNIAGGPGITRTVDMSSLGALTYNGPTMNINVGGSNAVGGTQGVATLLLAGTSSVTASSLTIGYISSGQNNTNVGTVSLGQASTINIATIVVGPGKGTATLNFQNTTNPTLVIRGTNGGNTTANLSMAITTSSQHPATSLIDLTSNVTGTSTLDARIGTLLMATSSNTRNATATLLMGGGTLDANSIIMGRTSGTPTVASVVTATISLSGGTISANTITMADFPSLNSPTSSATFTLNSGTLRFGSLVRGSSAGTAGVVNFNWIDGTIGNIAGSNQTLNGTSTLSGLTGGLTIDLNNTGNISGTHTWNVVSQNTSTVANNVLLSGSGSFTKTGVGALILDGPTSYTGTTTVAAGQLVVGTGNLAGTSLLTVASGAALTNGILTPAILNLSSLSLDDGSTVTLAYSGSTIATVASAGIATATGNIRIGFNGSSISAGTYDLITGGVGSTLNSATYTFLNPVSFTFTPNVTATAVSITATPAAAALSSALWIGGFAGAPGVWAVSDGSANSNWLDSSGPVATPLVPGITANVTFSAPGATNQTGMTLGTNMAINSLTQSSGSAMSLDTGIYLLTIGSNPLVATPGITVTSGAATINGGISLGIAQTWANDDTINSLTIGANVSNNSFLLTVGGAGATTISGVINGAGGLTKSGTGTLTLSGANVYTGTTTIDQGTLILANVTLPGALTFGSTSATTTTGSLNLSTTSATIGGAMLSQTNSSTPNTIIIGASQKLTVNGSVSIGANGTATNNRLTVSGAGEWVVNGNVNFGVGGTGTAAATTVLEMNAAGNPLAVFTANLGTGTFRIGTTDSTVNPADSNTVRLATTSTITATTMAIGSAAPHTSSNILLIGSGSGANRSAFNTNTLNIGNVSTGTVRSSGRVEFASSAGDLRIRALNGTGATTLNMVSSTTGTQTNLTADLLMAGHSADVLFSTITMARRLPTGTTTTTNSTATITFDAGNFEAATMIMSLRGGSSLTTGQTIANATFGGGTVNLGTVTMSQNSASNASTSGNAVSTLAFNGTGSNTVNSLSMGLNTVTGATATGSTLATLAHGGTATTTITTLNMAVNSAAISVTVANTATSTIELSGGTLNVTNLTMGNTTVNPLNVVNNSINITGGTLNLGGNITYTDGVGTETTAITLNGGTLNMGGFNIGATGALIGTLNFQAGTLQNVAQINDGAAITKTTTGVLTLAGTNAYTGSTTVNAGTLYANGANTSTTAGFVVQTSATLGGTGSIASATTVENGGTIQGGDSIATTGSLTTANVSIAGGGTLAANLGASGTASKLNIGANIFNISIGSNSVLKLTSIVAFDNTQNASWILVQGSPGAAFNVDGNPQTNFGSYEQGPGATGFVTIDPGLISLNAGDKFDLVRTGDNLVLNFTSVAVPEPGTILGLSAMGLGLAGWIRRRRGK